MVKCKKPATKATDLLAGEVVGAADVTPPNKTRTVTPNTNRFLPIDSKAK